MKTQPKSLVVHYRWEFLRRNEGYQADFDSFVDAHGDWFQKRGWWYDPDVKYSGQDLYHIQANIRPAELGLKMRWDIESLIPYEWSFDKSGNHELRRGVFVRVPEPFWQRRHGGVKRLAENELEVWAGRRGNSLEQLPDSVMDRCIYFYVDISFPVEYVMTKVESGIRKARHEYTKKYGPLPRHELRPRRRFDQFDDYLKVWDLRKKGMSFPKIAAQLFPGHESAAERVRDHFARADQLIAGGYRELE
jgi:Uncharacterized conserved protein (DUF2285)